MGTRAYRERERRELAASTTSISAPSASSPTPKSKDKHPRVYADNVHQELGMHVLAPAHHAKGEKNNEGIAGVIVTRSLEVKEERADDSGRAGF